MNATILVPLLVAILGGVGYALSSNAKIVELCRLAYGSGMLAICFYYAGKVVHL